MVRNGGVFYCYCLPMASVAENPPAAGRVPGRVPWLTLLWLGALLIVCYFPVLRHLVGQWSSDPDMGHGFFVPLVAGYIAWMDREKLLSVELKPNYWGFLLIGWGALQLVLGSLGAELFLQRTAFLFTLTGIVLVLTGSRGMRVLWFPLFLLLFMIPIPAVIYGQITLPLQLFASRVAEWALNLMGFPVLRDGNVLELASGQKLQVAEACSGIRSLLSLSFLSLVYGFFFDSRPWMRWVLLVATVPVAIIANAGRVTITGVLSEVNPDLAEGLFHSLEGWVIFLIALAILVILHQFISRVFGLIHARRNHPPQVSE